MKISLAVTMMALLTLLIAQEPAEPVPCPMGHHNLEMMRNMGEGIWDKIEDIAEELKLTDKQIEQIQQIRIKTKLDIIDLKSAVEKARLHLHIAMSDPEMTAGQLEQAFMSLQQAKQSLEMRKFRSLLEIREQLTPAQRRQAAKLLGQFRGSFKGAAPFEKDKKKATQPQHEGCPYHQQHKGKSTK